MTIIKCRVVDAGARYGIHSSWMAGKNFVQFDLYEPDLVESHRLSKKYSNLKNIKVRPLALDERSGKMQLKLRKHRGLSSLLNVAMENSALAHQGSGFNVIETVAVETRSLDEIYRSQPVHFLKLDTEGSELRILRGAEGILGRSVQGVRCEVSFTPTFAQGPLFADIDEYLRSLNFTFLNLDYRGQGIAESPFTLNGGYGRLVTTDAIWIRPWQSFLDMNEKSARDALLRQAFFLFFNGATDYAVKALIMFIEIGGRPADYRSCPMFHTLKKHISLLFKELTYLPQVDNLLLQDTWERIYGEKFPDLNIFWEKFDFE